MHQRDIVGDLLNHGVSPERRCESLALLRDAKISQQEKADIINLLLREQNDVIRFWATVHAASLGNATTCEILESFLDKEPPSIKRAALVSLTRLKGVEFIPTLLKRAHDPDSMLRRHALGLISKYKTEEAFGVLRDVLNTHEDPSMRFLAAVFLAFAGRSDGAPLLRLRLAERGVSFERLASMVGLSMLGDRVALETLRTCLTGLVSLGDLQRSVLIGLLRHRLGITGQHDEDVLQQGAAWVDAKLNGGQEGTRGRGEQE